jgi:hypothetical protein
MDSRLRTVTFLLALLALAAVASPARATLLLPGGDTLLNGGFDDVGYGATGNAFVTPLLFVGELGATSPPDDVDAVTDLVHDYVVDGLGSSLMTITYSIRNDGPDPFTDLRFLVNVQPDGSPSFSDTVDVTFGAPAQGEPDAFQVGDFGVDPLSALLGTQNQADGSNACGALPCDADLALEWDLAQLDPGWIWQIQVALSDDDEAISARFLRATSADTADTSLTFSGLARAIPEPSTALLVALGLLVLRTRR